MVRAAGRIARWRCKVPRCGKTGDGDLAEWRAHYLQYHMKDSYR